MSQNAVFLEAEGAARPKKSFFSEATTTIPPLRAIKRDAVIQISFLVPCFRRSFTREEALWLYFLSRRSLPAPSVETLKAFE